MRVFIAGSLLWLAFVSVTGDASAQSSPQQSSPQQSSPQQSSPQQSSPPELPSAEPSSPEVVAAAEAAFDEGRALMEAGEYPKACNKFRESHRMSPASGTLLNLGDCYDKEGKTASAWVSFRSCAALARQDGNTEREQEARARAEALQQVLSKLRILVPAAVRVRGLAIYRGDLLLGDALYGTAIPVDPGDHVVMARADGHVTWMATLHVPKVHDPEIPVVVEITVAKLQPLPKPASSPLPTPRSPPSPNAVPPTYDGAAGMSPHAVAGLVVATFGLATLGAGIGFGVHAVNTNKSSEEPGRCSADNFCQADGLTLRDQARTFGTLSSAFLAIGAVVTVGGTLWFFLAPDEKQTKTGTVQVSAGLTHFAFEARF